MPPEGVVDRLIDLIEPRRDSVAGVRWMRPESWHLTTAFMANARRSDIDELIQNLDDVAARTTPFQVSLQGAIAFRNVYKAKVLGMACPAEALSNLSQRSRTAADRAGVDVDGAKFVGHLTLLRHNRGFEATKIFRVIDSFDTQTWTANSFQLIESHLSDAGNRYETLAEFPFSSSTTRVDA